MKRIAAGVILLLVLAALVKLVGKSDSASPTSAVAPAAPDVRTAPSIDQRQALVNKYPRAAVLVGRVFDRYQHTAVWVERQEGLRGLELLESLDLEAVYLFERHPKEFHQLAAAVGDSAAGELLLHWREYFGLKRADDIDRKVLIDAIGRMPAAHRTLAARYPAALPLILADGDGLTALVNRLQGDPKALNDALLLVNLVGLDGGNDSLRRALAALESYPERGLEAFRTRGPDGFALVMLYGDVLDELGDFMPLDEALIVLQINSDDIDELRRARTASQLAAHLRHVHAAGLTEAVGSSVHGVRLIVEFGSDADRALAAAGGDAGDVVYESFTDPALRRQAVLALGRYGPMAAAMLAKYAPDPDFRAILARDGAEIIPPIARADVNPQVLLALQNKSNKSFPESLAQQVLAWSGDNGQATIRTIRHDGLARVAELTSTDVQFYQFLPLYDLVHLGQVMAGGHAPTGGEMTWAAVDAAFVVWDVLTLTAAQPEATAAGEAARGELKSTVRQAARVGGRELAEQGVQRSTVAAGRAARWWAVRSAGGLYRVLRKAPAALGSMSLEQVARWASPLCRKAGLRLSTWAPLRFAKDGVVRVLSVPAERWSKYVALNVAQAGVGVVAIHKMEEYMASRRAGAE